MVSCKKQEQLDGSKGMSRDTEQRGQERLDGAAATLSYEAAATAANKYWAQISTRFKYWNSVEQNGRVQQNHLFLVIPRYKDGVLNRFMAHP